MSPASRSQARRDPGTGRQDAALCPMSIPEPGGTDHGGRALPGGAGGSPAVTSLREEEVGNFPRAWCPSLARGWSPSSAASARGLFRTWGQGLSLYLPVSCQEGPRLDTLTDPLTTSTLLGSQETC